MPISVSTAGLHRVLADARPADADVEVSFRAQPGDVASVDATVTAELGRTLDPPGGTIDRQARSDSFALPDQPSGEVRELAVLGYAEGLPDHVTLVDGAWPGDVAAAEAPIPVAISTDVAASLGLAVGDRLALQSRADATFATSIEVAAIFRIDDPADPYWWDEPQVTGGIVTSERFATHGPFFTSLDALLGRATPARIEVRWHAVPASADLDVRDVGGLATSVRGLKDRLSAQLGAGVGVSTGLPGMLTEADRSLLVSRAGVLLVTIQLVVLAAYAVLLSASLLIERRRIDTAMLRSRGAGRWRIVGLTAIEAVVVTAPIAIVAPWLAAATLGVFNLAGPLADAGLVIEPRVTVDAYVAAAAASIVCFAALVLPQLRSSRQFATVHGSLARGETASIGQRLGIDVALLAVAGLGFWQLRQYGAPLTRSVQGTLGLDPLLIATPALGLLAGGVAALRIVPLLAQLAERTTVRRRGLVSALGARQLARRPLRYTRAALLLMLAMAMGVFAVCYTSTWSVSQGDQAAFQVGADVRVQSGRQLESMPAWALDSAYRGAAGRRCPGTDRPGHRPRRPIHRRRGDRCDRPRDPTRGRRSPDGPRGCVAVDADGTARSRTPGHPGGPAAGRAPPAAGRRRPGHQVDRARRAGSRDGPAGRRPGRAGRHCRLAGARVDRRGARRPRDPVPLRRRLGQPGWRATSAADPARLGHGAGGSRVRVAARAGGPRGRHQPPRALPRHRCDRDRRGPRGRPGRRLGGRAAGPGDRLAEHVGVLRPAAPGGLAAAPRSRPGRRDRRPGPAVPARGRRGGAGDGPDLRPGRAGRRGRRPSANRGLGCVPRGIRQPGRRRRAADHRRCPPHGADHRFDPRGSRDGSARAHRADGPRHPVAAGVRGERRR